MDWNYFKELRNVTLEDYVKDCASESEAIQKFSGRGITNIPLNEIKQIFSSAQNVSSDSSKEVDIEVVEPETVTTVNKKSKVSSGSTGN